jgi:hypothetical protein
VDRSIFRLTRCWRQHWSIPSYEKPSYTYDDPVLVDVGLLDPIHAPGASVQQRSRAAAFLTAGYLKIRLEEVETEILLAKTRGA